MLSQIQRIIIISQLMNATITNLYDGKRSHPVYIRVSILNFIELLLNRGIIKFNQLVHSMIGRNVRTSNGLNKFGTGDLKRD